MHQINLQIYVFLATKPQNARVFVNITIEQRQKLRKRDKKSIVHQRERSILWRFASKRLLRSRAVHQRRGL